MPCTLLSTGWAARLRRASIIVRQPVDIDSRRVMAAPPKPLSVDIHTSVKEGDMAKVLEFLEEGGDVNVRCRCGNSFVPFFLVFVASVSLAPMALS